MKLNHCRNRAGMLPAPCNPLWRSFLVILLLTIVGWSAAPLRADAGSQVNRDGSCIILLHGLGRSSMSMKGLQWRLQDEGYAVVNRSYVWLGKRIEDIAPLVIGESLAECQSLGKSGIGFVTHSLGGILLRQYLATRSIDGLGRVVMLAPPNQGSTTADYLVANGMLEPFLPEPARQLGTGENSVPQRLGPVNFELGVIAGSNTRALLSPGLEGTANDGTVAVDETRVEGMQDFLVLPVDHSFLMWSGAVLDQVVLFLDKGHFDHSSSGPLESSD